MLQVAGQVVEVDFFGIIPCIPVPDHKNQKLCLAFPVVRLCSLTTSGMRDVLDKISFYNYFVALK